MSLFKSMLSNLWAINPETKLQNHNVILFEKPLNSFSQQLCHFTFLSATHKHSSFPTSLPILFSILVC